jgi:hypothetical protein
MKCLIYDSANYSKEGSYGERAVLWTIETDNGPVAVNIVGFCAEAWLELPATANMQEVDWMGDDVITQRIRRKIESILAEGIESYPCAEVDFKQRFKLIGYHEKPNCYFRVRCEKRCNLDAFMAAVKAPLTERFNGMAPVWRETEIDLMTKMFIVKGWERSGWIELPEDYKMIDAPLENVDSTTVTEPMMWIDRTSETRPVNTFICNMT